MKRYLTSHILKDLPHKIVLLSGPRQCGKTTLSKQLYNDFEYLNYDAQEDLVIFKEKTWDRKKSLVIFDELHKMSQWKKWLKGLYDKEGIPPQILVTGSAKLDTYRKVGDSLAGRYFQYRLHPLDLKEITKFSQEENEKLFDRLWDCSGFPEPFLEGEEQYYRRWRKSHLDIILRQDLIDLHTVSDIKAIELLVSLLKKRIGSQVSYASLARDLQRDEKTVKRWLNLLESLYVIFRVTPYSKNIARSLIKGPKFYFYDHTHAENDHGARLENIVACALIKELHYLEDTKGITTSLHYLRTKDGKEIDFCICQNGDPTHLIEVKYSDDKPASGFKHFGRILGNASKLQLVKTLSREKTYPDGLEVRSLIPWLVKLDLL
ncbi:MAG: ATP-binding protein [Gammaproteobacteria bacterium]